jgi:hypothetical protein
MNPNNSKFVHVLFWWKRSKGLMYSHLCISLLAKNRDFAH